MGAQPRIAWWLRASILAAQRQPKSFTCALGSLPTAIYDRVLVLSGHIECTALEPTRPVLRPGLAFIDRLCYVSQTARGEVMGGAEVPERPQVTLASDLPALAATANVYAEMLPALSALSALRILRQWAGLIHATQDFGPLIGPHPLLPDPWITAGWSYGFASSAAVGELLARSIRERIIHPILAPFAVDRFERNAPVLEGGIVLAQTT